MPTINLDRNSYPLLLEVEMYIAILEMSLTVLKYEWACPMNFEIHDQECVLEKIICNPGNTYRDIYDGIFYEQEYVTHMFI